MSQMRKFERNRDSALAAVVEFSDEDTRVESVLIAVPLRPKVTLRSAVIEVPVPYTQARKLHGYCAPRRRSHFKWSSATAS